MTQPVASPPRLGPGSVVLAVAAIALAAIAGYVLLRRWDLTGSWMRAHAVAAPAIYAIVVVLLLAGLSRLGARHARLIHELGPAAPLALIAATLPALGGLILLGSLPSIGPWLRQHELTGVVLYALAFALSSGLALLPTYAQSLLGGWAFGVWAGFPAALVGCVVGATLGYEIARRAASAKVMHIVERNVRLAVVRRALIGEGRPLGFWRCLGLVVLVRLPPNSPFALTNLVLASVRVPRLCFVAGTAAGLAPRTAVAVWLASQVADLVEAPAGVRPGWLTVAGLVVSLVAVAVIGAMANRALARVGSAGPAEVSDSAPGRS